jgi:predicted DNA-binding transcriptional regulator AlpA
VDGPRQRTELDDLTGRLAAMPLVDQYEFAARAEQLLNLDRPLLYDEAAKRKETLECLRQAAAHHGLKRPLKVDEYERVQEELGLAWSWQRIHRLWLSFGLAAGAAAGGPLPTTWQQRDFSRRFVRRRTGGIEESLSAVRAWLAAEPATLTRKSYDEFARQHNLTLAEDGTPLPRAELLADRLGLSFADVLAAAKGEKPLPELLAHARDNRDWSEGPDDLISVGTLALLAGVSRSAARYLIQDADFPRPVLVFRRCRIWLREEVQAFLAGERLPLGEPGRLHDRYVSTSEAAKLLALGMAALNDESKTPLRPVAQVGLMKLWLRSEIEGYVAGHRADIARRLRQRARPGMGDGKKLSRFVTLSGFAAEVGMTLAQAQRVFNEPGFPAPAAWFARAGVWLREDVEQHLLGNPVPARPANALQDLLMTGGELRDYLAYAPSSARSGRMDTPPPVAVSDAGNIYLRADVEAHLDADPRRRELLEARRSRRAQPARTPGS